MDLLNGKLIDGERLLLNAVEDSEEAVLGPRGVLWRYVQDDAPPPHALCGAAVFTGGELQRYHAEPDLLEARHDVVGVALRHASLVVFGHLRNIRDILEKRYAWAELGDYLGHPSNVSPTMMATSIVEDPATARTIFPLTVTMMKMTRALI